MEGWAWRLSLEGGGLLFSALLCSSLHFSLSLFSYLLFSFLPFSSLLLFCNISFLRRTAEQSRLLRWVAAADGRELAREYTGWALPPWDPLTERFATACAQPCLRQGIFSALCSSAGWAPACHVREAEGRPGERAQDCQGRRQDLVVVGHGVHISIAVDGSNQEGWRPLGAG